jgi:hypothetical protein
VEQTFKVRLRFMFHYHNIQERRLQAAYLVQGLRPVERRSLRLQQERTNRE